MRALVVYESMYGNTKAVAQEIADGIQEGGAEVEVRDVAAPGDGVAPCDLLVVGGPTHALSMSRQSTRESAVQHGASASAATGIREWIDLLGDHVEAGRTATFDTRIDTMRHWPGSAAKGARRALKHHGIADAEVESFYVDGEKGPLREGEAERARAWGRHLAEEGR